MGNRPLSGHLADMGDFFRKYEADGVALEAPALRAFGALMAACEGLARDLETALLRKECLDAQDAASDIARCDAIVRARAEGKLVFLPRCRGRGDVSVAQALDFLGWCGTDSDWPGNGDGGGAA